MNATALIAEDEPLLAQALQTELARAWPELRVLATTGDGASAVQQALTLRPEYAEARRNLGIVQRGVPH